MISTMQRLVQGGFMAALLVAGTVRADDAAQAEEVLGTEPSAVEGPARDSAK